MLRHFVEVNCAETPDVVDEVASFLACCKVLDIMSYASRDIISTDQAAERLEKAVVDHMRKYLACYGDIYIKPKHHWWFDIVDQIG